MTLPPVPVVVGVAVIRPHVMRLLFADGVVRDLEYIPDKAKGSLLQPLVDIAYFDQVRVDHEAGTVAWPNGLDLAPDVLHNALPQSSDSGFRDVTGADQSA